MESSSISLSFALANAKLATQCEEPTATLVGHRSSPCPPIADTIGAIVAALTRGSREAANLLEALTAPLLSAAGQDGQTKSAHPPAAIRPLAPASRRIGPKPPPALPPCKKLAFISQALPERREEGRPRPVAQAIACTGESRRPTCVAQRNGRRRP